MEMFIVDGSFEFTSVPNDFKYFNLSIQQKNSSRKFNRLNKLYPIN